MGSAVWQRGKLGRFWFRASGKVRIFVLDALLRPLRPADMVRFGSYYGGWWIPKVDTSGSVAICVGAGTDVTFDLELRRLGYDVFTVDPTPASVEYLRTFEKDLTVLPVGVWTESGQVEFAQDATWTESWTIGSATAGTGDAARDTFPVVTVKELVETTGASEVSVLKLDIEGAEHAVLRSMVSDEVRPHCLCVEFDDHRIRAVMASTKLLRRHGYELYQIEGLNYMFVRDERALSS